MKTNLLLALLSLTMSLWTENASAESVDVAERHRPPNPTERWETRQFADAGKSVTPAQIARQIEDWLNGLHPENTLEDIKGFVTQHGGAGQPYMVHVFCRPGHGGLTAHVSPQVVRNDEDVANLLAGRNAVILGTYNGIKERSILTVQLGQ